MKTLRPFHYNERTLKPLQAAVADYPWEFIVEQCISMKGEIRNRRKLEFKIRWAGYDESNDTWEPWDHVKNNDAVQLYLYNHPNPRVRKLVNKSFIPPSERNEEESEDNMSID